MTKTPLTLLMMFIGFHARASDEPRTQVDIQKRLDPERLIRQIEQPEVGRYDLALFGVRIGHHEYDLTAERSGAWYRNFWGTSYFVVDWDITVQRKDWSPKKTERFHLQFKRGEIGANNTLRVNGRVVGRSRWRNKLCTNQHGVEFCAMYVENAKANFKHKLMIVNADGFHSGK